MSAPVASGVRPPDFQSGRTAEPEPIIEAIERVQEGDFFDEDDRLPELSLPGFGQIQDSCGDDFLHFCDNCADLTIFGETCFQSMCPRCWKAWVMRTCDGHGKPDQPGIVCQLESLRKLMYSKAPPGTNPKFHHLQISPDLFWRVSAENPLERTIEVIYDIMDELGIQGFVFPHPYRGDSTEEPAIDYGDLPDSQAEIPVLHEPREDAEDTDDRGFWKDFLNDEDLQRPWEEAREDLRLSWHFHIIGVADYVKGKGVVEDVEDQTGWVIHRITAEDSPVSIPDLESLAGVAMYCLSHTGIYETPAGHMRAAYRRHGRDLNGIEVFEKTREECRLACRKRAPRVLGMHAPKLACDNVIRPDPDPEEDPTPSTATDAVTAAVQDELRRRSGTPGGTTSNGSDAVAGLGGGPWRPEDEESDDDQEDGDVWNPAGAGTPASSGGLNAPGRPSEFVEDVDEEGGAAGGKGPPPPEGEICNGAFLSIAHAKRLLDDDDFVEQAPDENIARLREAREEWKERKDWIP